MRNFPWLIFVIYSVSQEICTRVLLCCALLWLYISWFSYIHQAYFTGTVAIDCPSASKATLMNMDKYFMWIHYERLHNHSKAKHNKTVCIFLGIYCTLQRWSVFTWIIHVMKICGIDHVSDYKEMRYDLCGLFELLYIWNYHGAALRMYNRNAFKKCCQ